MKENRWQIQGQLKNNLWLFAYSVMNAKRFSKKFTLHTDQLGAEYYGELGYDEVKVTLDVMKDEMSRFWSKGKILALSKEPAGSIHIDGDVFIKSEKMLEVFSFKDYDLITQGEERLGIFMKHYYDTIPHYPFALWGKMPKGLDPTLKHSLNCGVLGFNNVEIMDDYFKGYFKMIDDLKQSDYFMRLLGTDPKIEPNIIIEQFYLAGLCKEKKAKIKYVLPLKSNSMGVDETITEMNRVANDIGYAHAWGSTKYALVPAIKRKIKEQDIEYFRKVDKITKRIAV